MMDLARNNQIQTVIRNLRARRTDLIRWSPHAHRIHSITRLTPSPRPFEAEHQRIEAAADAEQGDAVAGPDVAPFDAEGCRQRERCGARIAEELDCCEVDGRIEPQP